MLLSSASATPDVPSASAVATTNCLLSEYGLRDMACSLTAVAVKRNGPGADKRRDVCTGTVGVDKEVLPPSDRASRDGDSAFAPGFRASVPSVTRVRIPVRPQQRV